MNQNTRTNTPIRLQRLVQDKNNQIIKSSNHQINHQLPFGKKEFLAEPISDHWKNPWPLIQSLNDPSSKGPPFATKIMSWYPLGWDILVPGKTRNISSWNSKFKVIEIPWWTIPTWGAHHRGLSKQTILQRNVKKLQLIPMQSLWEKNGVHPTSFSLSRVLQQNYPHQSTLKKRRHNVPPNCRCARVLCFLRARMTGMGTEGNVCKVVFFDYQSIFIPQFITPTPSECWPNSGKTHLWAVFV